MENPTGKAPANRKRAKRGDVTEWQEKFIAALRNTGNVRAACQLAQISRKTAYQHRFHDPEFRSKWEDAWEDAIDMLEATALSRARAQSDTLLIFLLKARRPEIYRETVRQEHTGAGGGPIEQRTVNVTVRVEGEKKDMLEWLREEEAAQAALPHDNDPATTD